MQVRYLQFTVISEGAEHLVMGYLMRRNILTYKAPPGNEGYDLICIHPDPRHKPAEGEKAQVRVQVKSRYPTGSRQFLLREKALDAFDFLVVALLNIGDFRPGHDGTTGEKLPKFYTLLAALYNNGLDLTNWGNTQPGHTNVVRLRQLGADLALYRDGAGFELIASALGIPRPSRPA